MANLEGIHFSAGSFSQLSANSSVLWTSDKSNRFDSKHLFSIAAFLNYHTHIGDRTERSRATSLEEYFSESRLFPASLRAQNERDNAKSFLAAGTGAVLASSTSLECNGLRIINGTKDISAVTSDTGFVINRFCAVSEGWIAELASIIRSVRPPYLSCHVSSSLEEDCRERHLHGSIIAILDRYNLIGPRTYLVHCGYLKNRELRIIAERNAKIVLCPSSDRALGCKILDPTELDQMGIEYYLGTDSIASSGTPSMLDQVVCLLRLFPDASPEKLLSAVMLATSGPMSTLRRRAVFPNPLRVETLPDAIRYLVQCKPQAVALLSDSL